VVEEEFVYKYKRHKFELDELASIGDSVLVSFDSTAIRYNGRGLRSEETTMRTNADGFKRREKTIVYDYNRRQKLKRQVEKNIEFTAVSLYEYGNAGELVKLTWKEPTEAMMLYQYDEFGRKMRTVVKDEIADIVTDYAYNSNGDIIRSVQSDGFTVQIERNRV
jgi:hypothetical protein